MDKAFSEPRVLGSSQAALSALLLAVLASLFGLLFNSLSARPLALTKPIAEQSGEIGVREVWEVVNRGGVMFLDARDEGSYRRSHLPGAERLSPEEFESRYPELRERLRGARLIVYCSGPRCIKADQLREKLEAVGLQGVELMRAGLAGWIEADYPLEHE